MKARGHNSTFAIGKASHSADSFEDKESSVLRLDFCAEKPVHRKSAIHWHFIMMTKTKYMLTVLILTCGLFAFGQDPKTKDTKSKFSLSISTYNHAEQMFNGVTTYNLTDSLLTVRESSMWSELDTLLFSKKLNDNSIYQIESIQLDSLKDFYFNNCIMATSGNEYFISKTVDTITQKISLHHYYEPQIEKLFEQINKHVPDKLKHDYLAKDTQQDCKP